MKTFVDRIVNFFWKGEYKGNNAFLDAESRRNHLVKIACIIAFNIYVSFVIIYMIIDFSYLLPMILNLFIFSILFLIALQLLKREKYKVAKIIVLFSLTTPIFIGSGILFGRDPGIHIYFFLFALAPIVFWSFEKKGSIILFFLLNIACFFYVEYLMPAESALIPFPEEHLTFIRSLSFFLSFIVIGLIILLYQKLAENKEELLLEANKDLERKTQELTELNKTKDKFFSIIAHDLKNPFGAILKGMELISENYDRYTDEKRKRLIDTIRKTSISTYELLDKLLEWGKIKTNSLHPHFDNIDMNGIVLDVVDLYEKLLSDKSISIHVDLEKNLLVYADHYMLSVIVRNLISNAIKFTPRKGNIKILSEPGKDGFVDIAFVDSGIGISEKDQAYLFKIDKSFSSPGTEKEQGTGLGLHLCKEYIEKIFGHITVFSKPGEGSRFTISLRRACE